MTDREARAVLEGPAKPLKRPQLACSRCPRRITTDGADRIFSEPEAHANSLARRMLFRKAMSSPSATVSSNRTGFLFLFLTLLLAGLEVWGIRASIGYLLK